MYGLVSALVWTLGVLGSADGDARSLRWEAPAGCPSDAQVRARLAKLLGEGTFSGSAEARVSGGGASWRLDLAVRWRDHDEARSLEAATCDGLADAAVLLLALLAEKESGAFDAGLDPVDPEPGAAPVAVEPPDLEGPEIAKAAPSEEPEPEPEVEVLPSETSEPSGRDPERSGAPMLRPSREARRARAKGFALQVGGGIDYGSLAGVAGGLGLGVVALTERFRVVLGGRYLPPRRTGSAASYARNGRLNLGYARLGACVRLGRGRVEAPICAGFEVGALRASGFGVAADRGALDLWVGAAAGPSLMVELTRHVVLFAEVELAAPIARSRYVFADDVLYETARVPVRAGLGVEFRIPNQIRRKPENPPLSGDRDPIP